MELSKKQIKAIFITGISILLVILLFIIISILVLSKEENKNINITTGFSSIKEIIESHRCIYKNDTYSQSREYPTEINLVFRCNLYENNQSNEEFFNDIFEDIAKFINYTNFQMIDKEHDITAKVLCQDGKIYKIIINDIEDYFIYMDSQLELTQYKELETTNLIIEAPEVQKLIDNNWSSNTDLGTRESFFQNYYLNIDEGIKFKKVAQNIYNIIFTNAYLGTVVNGISVGTPLDSIESRLGEATFKDEDLNVIGYKGKDIYAFFTNNEISIYRCRSYDYDEFWDLVDDFLNDKYTFKEFMNELTYTWNDYSEYTYQNDYLFISYPNKGIDVKLNADNISGIVVYNNISEKMNVVKKYLENTEFISRLKLDNVFEAEKRRLESDKTFETKCKEFEEENKISTNSMYYNYYIEKDLNGNSIAVYFKSKEMDFPDRELNDAVDTYAWANEYYFIYSVYGKGIYCFNVSTGEKNTVVEGKEKYEIKEYRNDVLKYDNDEIILEFN